MPSDLKSYKNFLDLKECTASDIESIIACAIQLKHELRQGKTHHHLAGKQLAMAFEKPSTRTRVSFEVGINQLGGQAIIMDTQTSQMGNGEPISDTARVLSRYVDIIMLRCFSHEQLLDLAEAANVPVINGLTNNSHPCQVMADLLTIQEYLGAIEGKRIAWISDGNNMAHSWIEAAALVPFTLVLATPESLQPRADAIQQAKAKGADIIYAASAEEAAKDADVVTTDCWVSMGDSDTEARRHALAPYQVNEAVMACAKKEAIFLHCLPAYRGQEVTSAVIDGPQSAIYDEAENRLHVQKAIMLWCLGL